MHTTLEENLTDSYLPFTYTDTHECVIIIHCLGFTLLDKDDCTSMCDK